MTQLCTVVCVVFWGDALIFWSDFKLNYVLTKNSDAKRLYAFTLITFKPVLVVILGLALVRS